MPCEACGEPALFGPRQTRAIKTGMAHPVCGDCVVKQIQAGWLPAGVINLGNPEKSGGPGQPAAQS